MLCSGGLGVVLGQSISDTIFEWFSEEKKMNILALASLPSPEVSCQDPQTRSSYM